MTSTLADGRDCYQRYRALAHDRPAGLSRSPLLSWVPSFSILALAKFHGPVPLVELANDFAPGRVQLGKERGPAGPGVIVGLSFRLPGGSDKAGWVRSKAWIYAFSSTHRARAIGRIEVESHDVRVA